MGLRSAPVGKVYRFVFGFQKSAKVHTGCSATLSCSAELPEVCAGVAAGATFAGGGWSAGVLTRGRRVRQNGSWLRRCPSAVLHVTPHPTTRVTHPTTRVTGSGYCTARQPQRQPRARGGGSEKAVHRKAMRQSLWSRGTAGTWHPKTCPPSGE